MKKKSLTNSVTSLIQDSMECCTTKLEVEELRMVKKVLDCPFFFDLKVS